MNNILLDTNILIYLLGGNKALREMLEDKNWFVSYITEMELLMKPEITEVELRAIESILDECFIIEMNDAIKNEAIQNARLYRLKLADSIVLASAQVNHIPFMTADSSFKKIAQTTKDVLLFVP